MTKAVKPIISSCPDHRCEQESKMSKTGDDGIMPVDKRSVSIKENYLQNLSPAWVERVHKFPERTGCLNESYIPSPEDLHPRILREPVGMIVGDLGLSLNQGDPKICQETEMTKLSDFQKVDNMVWEQILETVNM